MGTGEPSLHRPLTKLQKGQEDGFRASFWWFPASVTLFKDQLEHVDKPLWWSQLSMLIKSAVQAFQLFGPFSFISFSFHSLNFENFWKLITWKMTNLYMTPFCNYIWRQYSLKSNQIHIVNTVSLFMPVLKEMASKVAATAPPPNHLGISCSLLNVVLIWVGAALPKYLWSILE